MSIEAMIGVAYCLIALVFVVGMAMKAHRNRDFREPGQTITAFVWPLIVVLWLIQRSNNLNTEETRV